MKCKCRSCAYGASLGMDGLYYCNYMGITGKRRPCKADPVTGCDEYKPMDKKTKAQISGGIPFERRRIMYMHHDEALDLYKEGKTDREIADAIGVAKVTIWKWREKFHLAPNADSGGNTAIDYGKIQELYRSGMNDCEIADQIGCHMKSVYNWRARNKLPPNAHRRYKGST